MPAVEYRGNVVYCILINQLYTLKRKVKVQKCPKFFHMCAIPFQSHRILIGALTHHSFQAKHFGKSLQKIVTL